MWKYETTTKNIKLEMVFDLVKMFISERKPISDKWMVDRAFTIVNYILEKESMNDKPCNKEE